MTENVTDVGKEKKTGKTRCSSTVRKIARFGVCVPK